MEQPRVLYLLTAEISKVLVQGQLDALHAAGFDVTVGVGLESGTGANPGRGWDESAEVRHIPFRRQPAPLADIRALRATVRLIREIEPGIVNASTPKAGLLGMAAARWCRVPVRVYHLRGLRFETTTGWRRRLLVLLEQCAAGMATHVIVNGPSTQQAAITAGIGRRNPPVLIGAGSGNGIDVDRYAPSQHASRAATRSELGIPADAIVIGFVGRLTRDKGIGDLLDVFEKLTTGRSDLHLLLVGDVEPGDPVSPDVEQRIESRSDITQLPWVADTSVLYAGVDLLVFPSAREGLPNVPLQAQSASVPVIGYAATGTVDAVSDGVTGVLVEPGDVDGLGEAVRALIDDARRREALGAAGPAWVRERFAQDAFWAALIETYREWTTATA
jgi:glycosyltransferase involved in cell wall biosynthesis